MFKILGWTLLSIFILFLIVIVAAVVLIARLNPADYKTRLEKMLSEKSGYHVSLGELSSSKETKLGWEAQGVAVRKSRTEDPLFRAERVLLQLDFFSLLTGRIIATATVEEGLIDYVPQKGANHLVLVGITSKTEIGFPSNHIKVRGAGWIATPQGPEVTWRLDGHPQNHLDFEMRYKKETLLLTGEVFAGVDPPRFRAELKAQELDILEIMRLAGARQGDPVLSGTSDGLLKIEGSGKTDKEIQRSLVGQGRFEIKNGTLLDFNIVQYLLKQIAILPALGELIQSILPPEFQEVIQSSTTAFEFMELNFSLQGNQITIPSMILKGTEYIIESEGSFDFEHNVNFKARLILLENLSAYLIERIPELTFIANEQKRIVIPFVYRGVWPKARPLPDLGYLADRFFKKGIGGLLEQGLELLEQFGGKQTT